ncbi:MAG: hypothetical protein AAF995_07400 [Planctomycetota bacterium]
MADRLPDATRARLPTTLLGMWAALATLGLAFSAFLMYSAGAIDRVRPTAESQTLAGFLRSMPEPRAALWLESGDTAYLVLEGHPAKTPSVSGPPLYVFDDSERLVDWTVDEGDDAAFHERWDRSRAEPVPVPELRATPEPDAAP